MTINGHHVLLDEDDSESRGAAKPELTKEEDEAVKSYTNGKFGPMNGYMRTGTQSPNLEKPEEIRAACTNLQSALAKSTLGEMTLYRGLGPSAFGPQDDEDKVHFDGNSGKFINDGTQFDFSKTVGDTFTDNGFVSTSSDKDASVTAAISRSGVSAIAEIEIPEGTHGLVVATDQTDYKDEHEVILQPGLSYHVESAEKVPVYWKAPGFTLNYTEGASSGDMGDGKWLLHLKVVKS